MTFPQDRVETDRNADVARAGSAEADRISFETPTSLHLEAALDADQPVEKNYHIRSALQRIMILEENRSD